MDDTLEYSIGQEPKTVDEVTGGRWTVAPRPGAYGPALFRMTAKDNARSLAQVSRLFEVVSSYMPKSIDEPLDAQRYLYELLQFASKHLTTGGQQGDAPVTPEVLEQTFNQPFGALAQPRLPHGARMACDLLIPVRMLRAREKTQGKAAALELTRVAALIGRWTFEH